jgi:hypothetical protein
MGAIDDGPGRVLSARREDDRAGTADLERAPEAWPRALTDGSIEQLRSLHVEGAEFGVAQRLGARNLTDSVTTGTITP